MLIGFTVENFKSIRDACSLSLEASNYYKENDATLISRDIPGKKGVRVLPASAIYGANASGKSTLVDALGAMRAAVLAHMGENLDPLASFEPFLLDQESRHRPMNFSVEFCLRRERGGGQKLVRYEYSFAVSDRGVESEELRAYFTRQPSRLFSRSMSPAGDITIDGSKTFPISAEAKRLVGPRLLVLSLFTLFEQTAVAGAGDEARAVCDWFRGGLTVVDQGPGQQLMDTYSGKVLDGAAGSDYQRQFIRDVMRRADMGITSVEVRHDALGRELPEPLRGLLSEEVGQQFERQPVKRVAFFHQAASGDQAEVPSESAGTLRLFQLAGYLGRAIETGGTLVVDELDASLHPDLADALVSLLLDPSINKHGAQLVFTAHNPCLMDNPLMRRDEFWIMEKGEDGTSTLHPVSDFKIRKGDSLRAGYLAGKYAGLPDLRPGFGVEAPAGDDSCGRADSKIISKNGDNF